MEWLQNRTKEWLKTKHQLVTVAGIECSGKTTFIERNLERQKFRRISMDEIYDEVTHDPERIPAIVAGWLAQAGTIERSDYSPHEFLSEILQLEAVDRALITSREILSRGRKVVFDGLFLNPASRAIVTQHTRRFVVGGLVCYWMNTPLEVCIARFHERGAASPTSTRILNDEIIRKHASEFISPTLEEGFDAIIEVPYKPAWR